MSEIIKEEERKNLYLKSIKELRLIGRKAGVKAPASLCKKDLIESILSIVLGETKNQTLETRGRPAKLDDYGYNATTYGVSNLTFKSVSSARDKTYISGLLWKNEKGYYLVGDKFNILTSTLTLSSNFVKKNNLRIGDLVEILMSDMYITLIGVNGHKYDEGVIVKNFEDIGVCYPTKYYKLKGDLKIINEVAPIAEGSRTVVFLDKSFNYPFICNLTNALDLNNKFLNIYVVCLEKTKEDIQNLYDLGISGVVNINSASNSEDLCKMMTLIIERVKRLSEVRMNSLIILDDIFIKKQFLKDTNIKNMLISLFNIGASLKNKSSISTMALFNTESDMYKEVVLEASNFIEFDLNNNIVAKKCKTLFADKFLSETEYKIFKNNKKSYK